MQIRREVLQEAIELLEQDINPHIEKVNNFETQTISTLTENVVSLIEILGVANLPLFAQLDILYLKSEKFTNRLTSDTFFINVALQITEDDSKIVAIKEFLRQTFIRRDAGYENSQK